jgi:hypothetical protein
MGWSGDGQVLPQTTRGMNLPHLTHNTTTNFRNGNRDWDKVSPKPRFAIVYFRSKPHAWLLLPVQVLRDGMSLLLITQLSKLDPYL